MKWQPIETAPKDGEEVLMFARGTLGLEYFSVGQYAKADPAFGTVDGWFWTFAIRPTHWMPLPEPPSEARTTNKIDK